MRGQEGRGRLTEVADRLRVLAASAGVPLAGSPETAPGAAAAARQAVLLGSRDILIERLVALLTVPQR